MSITSMNARLGMAEKLDIPELTRAVQDGTIPSYIGIPLIQDKMKQKAAAAPMQPKAPPVAQQIMQQAKAMEGIPALPSNMPEEYARGGILHYAEGDLVDDDDYDEMIYDDQMSEAQKQIAKIRDEMMKDQSASYGGIDYNEAPNPQVEYHRTPNKEEAKVTKGTPSDFESLAVARGKAHGVDANLVRHVMHKETGGLKDRANAVSPAGAIGVMQLMPATAKGLGVRNPYDPEQNIEGGVKYLAQLQRKYQDPKLAAIAYNWGPGNTDKWLASGADISRLPKETRGYIQNLAEGGIVGLAGGGMEGVRINPNQNFSLPPVDDLEKQKAMLERMRRMESAKAAFSEMPKPAPVAAAPVAQSSFLDAAKSALSRLRPGVGGLGVGLPALFHSEDLNANEEQELARRRAANPTFIPPSKPTSAVQNKPNQEDSGRAAFEAGVGNTQDTEDMEAGLNALAPVEQPKPVAEAEAGSSDIQEIKDLIKQRGEGLSKQKDIDNYMALLSAGLGMMGGTSPFAAANIGQGAQAGISHALQAQKSRAAEENALLSGRLGLYKYQQSAEANKMNKEYLQQYRQEQNRLKEMGLTDAKAKALADQEIKRNAEYDRVLGQMESGAKNMAIAKLKTAFTDQEKAKAEADALTGLYKNPRYREAYFARNKFYPDLSEASGGNKKVSWADMNK